MSVCPNYGPNPLEALKLPGNLQIAWVNKYFRGLMDYN